jgi:DKNYY family
MQTKTIKQVVIKVFIIIVVIFTCLLSLFLYFWKHSIYGCDKTFNANLEYGYHKGLVGVYRYFSNDDFCPKKIKIQGANKGSFEVLSKFYIRDANAVYYSQEVPEEFVVKIEGADPETFQVILDESRFHHYAKDEDSVFYQSRELEGADPDTFQVIGGRYAKDLDRMFFTNWGVATHHALGDQPDGIDCDTFEMLPDDYAKDKNAVYYQLSKIEGADVNTFEVGKRGYAKDSQHFYLNGETIELEDPKLFYVNQYFDENN